MEHLSHLLKRFKDSLGKDTLHKEIIRDVIQKMCGFTISDKDLALKGDALEIKLSAVKKSELMLKQDRILADINARTGLVIKRILYLS